MWCICGDEVTSGGHPTQKIMQIDFLSPEIKNSKVYHFSADFIDFRDLRDITIPGSENPEIFVNTSYFFERDRQLSSYKGPSIRQISASTY